MKYGAPNLYKNSEELYPYIKMRGKRDIFFSRTDQLHNHEYR